MSKVTVIGTGRMGSAMARRLSEAGHAVTVWNRTPASAQTLAGEGSIVASSSARDAVIGADVVIASLATGQATLDVLLDPALIAAMPPRAVVCDMGTSGVAAAHALADGLGRRRFVDCPVSGSVPTVEAGQLLVMAGGDEQPVRDATPVLGAFAREVIHVGGIGAGQSMKLCVNLIVHSLNSALAEALALAERSGIDPAQAYDVFEGSSIAAPYVGYKRRAFLDPTAPVAMSLALVRKDLGLIAASASAAGLHTPVLDGVQSEVADACDAGLGAEDMAQLVRHVLATARDTGSSPDHAESTDD